MSYKILFLSCVCFIGASSILSAATDLESQMTLQEKQQTGVVNLSKKQRLALAAWIDENYVPKSQSPSLQEELSLQPNPPMTQYSFGTTDAVGQLSISMNLQGGQQLVLSDSTRWQIQPQDVGITSLWLSPAPITLRQGTDTNYPFILTNLYSNQSVRAKQIVPGQIPPSAPPTDLSKPAQPMTAPSPQQQSTPPQK
ncbi:MAG: hypothetical protein EBZ47_00735 [Chlamydiae bacterium]|nr:hypothetical protein [Chlamydiota bacterium]